METPAWVEIIKKIANVFLGALIVEGIRFAFRNDRVKLRLEIDTGNSEKPVSYKGGHRYVSISALYLTVYNKGRIDVSLASAGMSLDKKTFIDGAPYYHKHIPYALFNGTFPFDLESGKQIQVFFDKEDINNRLKELGYSGKVKVFGLYKDQINNVYRSKPYLFVVE